MTHRNRARARRRIARLMGWHDDRDPETRARHGRLEDALDLARERADTDTDSDEVTDAE